MDNERLNIQADEEFIQCLEMLRNIRQIVERKFPPIYKNSQEEIDTGEFYTGYLKVEKYIDSLIVEKLRQDLGMY